MLPFTQGQFLEVMARYNEAVAPVPWILGAAAFAAAVLAWRGGFDRLVAATLALLWLWTALAYHAAFFTAINPAAWAFAAMFLAAAAAFAWQGVYRGEIRFGRQAPAARRAVGLTLIGVALVAYPLASLAAGHRYPAMPTFGLPCPITILTLGVLLLARAPLPRTAWVLPLAWSAIGGYAAFVLGMPEDFLLIAAGVAFASCLGSARWVARGAEAPPVRSRC